MMQDLRKLCTKQSPRTVIANEEMVMTQFYNRYTRMQNRAERVEILIWRDSLELINAFEYTWSMYKY